MTDLMARSGGVCEFCGGTDGLAPHPLPPGDEEVLLCATCRAADAPEAHWRCLEGAAWNPEPSVQIAVWRKLGEIDEGWATEARETMEIDPETFAKAAAQSADEQIPQHKDANGAALSQGDTVVLIKDLPVKGAGFTAKRGTAVRAISLVPDNAGQIEGRVEGQRIVILTQYVKKK